MKPAMPCRSQAELDAILAKYKDPAYMAEAVDCVAGKLVDELFPNDNEVRLIENVDAYRRGTE